MKITYDNGLLQQAIFNYFKSRRYPGIKYDNGSAKQSGGPLPAGPRFTYTFDEEGSINLDVRTDSAWGQRAMQLLNDITDIVGGEVIIYDPAANQQVYVTDYIIHEGSVAYADSVDWDVPLFFNSLLCYARLEDQMEAIGIDEHFDEVFTLVCDALPELYELDPFVTMYVCEMLHTYDDYEPAYPGYVMPGYGWIRLAYELDYFSELWPGYNFYTAMALFCILSKEMDGMPVADALESYFAVAFDPITQLETMYDDIGVALAGKDTDEVVATLEAIAAWFMYVLYDDNILNMLTMGQPGPSLYTYAASDVFNVLTSGSNAYPGSTEDSDFNDLGVALFNDIVDNCEGVYVWG